MTKSLIPLLAVTPSLAFGVISLEFDGSGLGVSVVGDSSTTVTGTTTDTNSDDIANLSSVSDPYSSTEGIRFFDSESLISYYRIELDSAGNFSAEDEFKFSIEVHRPTGMTGSTWGNASSVASNFGLPAITFEGDGGTTAEISSNPSVFGESTLPSELGSAGETEIYTITVDLDTPTFGSSIGDVIADLEAIEIRAEFWAGGGTDGDESALLTTVPEPSGFALLLGAGVLALSAGRRKRREVS